MTMLDTANTSTAIARSDQYSFKPDTYFANCPPKMSRELGAFVGADVLEIGCGQGNLGAAALKSGAAATYTGIELDPRAAAKAREVLTHVLCENIEEFDLNFFKQPFDAIACSEVLEHLVDPWEAVIKLSKLLKPGGTFIASTPNVAHYKIIKGLLSGSFKYTLSGAMDKTHLRWFTLGGMKDLFTSAGLRIEKAEPLTPLRPKAKTFNSITFGKFEHILYDQNFIVARKPL